MFSSSAQRGGFATIAIIGSTVVAVVVGGVFYFLRSGPVEVDTTLTDDSVAIIGDGSELSVDAEQVLLRSLPRGRGTDYCSLLGLDRDSCASGAEGVCRGLFGSCGIDLREDDENQRLLAEACLVLGNPNGQALYFAWLDGDDPNPFPLYHAIFGLSPDSFSQKDLSDAYQALLESYFSTSSCSNRDAPRLLTEAYLALLSVEGRAMYEAWLNGGADNPFPLYYAALGLREDAFTQEGADGAYRVFLNRYFAGLYGDNGEILRFATEAYMVLSTSSTLSAYNAVLGGGLLTDFSDASFAIDVRDLLSTLVDLALSPAQIGGVLGSFNLSPVDLSALIGGLNLTPSGLGALLGNLNLTPSDLGALIGNFNLTPSDLGSLFGNLNLTPSDLGALLGNLNLTPSDLGALLGNLNLTPSDFGSLLGNLNLTPSNLGSLLGNLNLTPSDLGALISNLDFSSDGLAGLSGNLGDLSDLGALLGNLNLTPSDLGTLISNLDFSSDGLAGLSGNLGDLSDLGSLLGNLNLTPSDLGILLGNLNLTPSDLGSLLGNLSLAPSDLGSLLSPLNLSVADLSALLSSLNLSLGDLNAVIISLALPPLDLDALTIALDIPPITSGITRPSGPFTGVTTPGAGSGDSSLPVVSIFTPFPYGQIGVSGDSEPSFILSVKGGSVTSADPILVILTCTQSVDGGQQASFLISGALPTSASLSASTTTIDLVRNPGVTGSVTCTVVLDRSVAEQVYTVGSSDAATITVVSGSSPIAGDSPTDDLPSVSISAVERSIASGEEAILRVTVNRNIVVPLRVSYACSAPPSVAIPSGGFIDIVGGSGGLFADITIQTEPGTSGYISCSLEDDPFLYIVRGRTASVAFGLLQPDDTAGDPTLPTVSLIAYRKVEEKDAEGRTTITSRRVSSALVDDKEVHLGFVIADPVGDTPFGTEVPGSRVEVAAGKLYVLTSTDFGATVSLKPPGLPSDPQVIKIGISSERKVPLLNLPEAERATLPLLDEPSNYGGDGGEVRLRQYPYPHVSNGGVFNDPDGNRVSIETQRYARNENGRTVLHDRVIVRKSVGEVVVCGFEERKMYCATYSGGFTGDAIRVDVQCYKDFSDDRDREASDVLVGGRYYDQNGYASKALGYVADGDDPDGELYEFILPDGSYISADAEQEGEIPLVLDPFVEPGVSFSCEIFGGGVADGYNVGFRQATVQVYPRPVVSIEPEGAVGIGDADPLGAPVATVSYGEREYTFSSDDDFIKDGGISADILADENASFLDVSGRIVQSVGVGFLTSFGSCVLANVFTGGISSLLDIGLFGLGKPKLDVENENTDTKECYLDVAATKAATEVLSEITRDYIIWAHEGFEGKPLFVRNPTTFYKNLRDDIIGRTIDRSGLGFLCDVGLGRFDAALTADIKINLQQRYLGLETVQPRCTYSDLANNLEEFYGDTRSFLTDFEIENLVDIGFDITLDPQYGGTTRILPSPTSDATNQLDALSANLERGLNQVQNSKNILLSLAELDDAVRQAEQDFAESAKPVAQLFNPNDPTSIGAFTECSDVENPEGDTDCFLLNVSGHRIANSVDRALDRSSNRLLHVDEFGEIGQLVKLAANATSAGLMKKYLRGGFGTTVARETADILTDIADSSSPYGSYKVGLGGMWWSAFFQDNEFYEDLLEAEFYARDVFTLLKYIAFSFYDGFDSLRGFPPTTPYNDFYTIHKNQTNCREFGPCEEGYPYLGDLSQTVLRRHFRGVLESDDPLNLKWSWREGVTHNILDAVFPDTSREYRAEALERFRDAYRFLSDLTGRQQYHAFVNALGNNDNVPLATSLYTYEREGWIKHFSGISLPTLDTDYTLPESLKGLKEKISDITPYASYPQDLETLKQSLLLTPTLSDDHGGKSRCLSGVSAGTFDADQKTDFLFELLTLLDASDPLPADKDSITAVHVEDGKALYESQYAYCTNLSSRCLLELKPYSIHGKGSACLIKRKKIDGGEETEERACLDALASSPAECEYSNTVCGGPGGNTTCTTNTHTCSADDLHILEDSLIEGYPKFHKSSLTGQYCPGDIAISSAAQSRTGSEDLQALREIYEATLAAHVHLVGLIDDYGEDDLHLTHAVVHAYRNDILSGRDSSGIAGPWQLVRDETFKKFRDGTMSVYLPLENGEIQQRHIDVLNGYACADILGDRATIKINHPSTFREYRETDCILGTVFQDQAYFMVRRRQSGFPELLNKSLHVDLACGYTNGNDDDRYQFVSSLVRRPITLDPNQDAVLFPVPKVSRFFDSANSDERNARSDRVRCSIAHVRYADGSEVFDLDEDNLTAVVQVSEIPENEQTFHSMFNAVLNSTSVPDNHNDRVQRIAAALFYTYVWGWYTGFIEMPYYSIQGLLSNPPVSISGGETSESDDFALQNQEFLQRYRLLASLFADESRDDFSVEHFGFLTPQEAFDKYKSRHKSRFDAYFGRVLGGFLLEFPSQYNQQ